MEIYKKTDKIDGIEFNRLICHKSIKNTTIATNFKLLFLLATTIIALLTIQIVIKGTEESQLTNLDRITAQRCNYDRFSDEINHLQTQINELRRKIKNLETDIVPQTINKALEVYDTDQIGYFDYAADYAGGSIIGTPETEPYPLQKLTILTRFEFKFPTKPEILLKTKPSPGDCYAFYGQKGRIHIKLNEPIIVTHITLEHIRFVEMDTKSAPRDFQVYGFHGNWQLLGNYTYNLDNNRIQTFPVVGNNRKFDLIELNILNNYGNYQYTCIYRFRVHSRKFS